MRHLQLPQLWQIVSSVALPSVLDTPERESYMGRVALTLPARLSFMPKDTLAWRLGRWLTEGCSRVTDARLATLGAAAAAEGLAPLRTLLVVGEDDRTLPSVDEARRLEALLRRTVGNEDGEAARLATTVVVPGAGHTSTLGSRCDLAALMRNNFAELRETGSKRTRMLDAASSCAETDVMYGLIPRTYPSVMPWLYWQDGLFAKVQPSLR